MRCALASALALACVACLPEQKFPGDEVMGTFEFFAEPVWGDCQGRADVPDGGFSFSGTFSRTQASSQAWFTLGGVSREASFDGQVVVSTRQAVRRFPECNCGDRVSVVETLSVALASRSQDQVLSGTCPERALDGGMPAPDPDAGILAPGSSERGFDAVLACGFLTDELAPDPGASPACTCTPCALGYRVSGGRR